MIRSFLADRLLDFLISFPIQKGKYRIAQLASFFLDGAPVRSRYGPLLHTRLADSTFWLAARFGNDEVVDLMADINSEDGFIDVGANIGLTTCLAAPRCAAVISFEPSQREFVDLQRNCALLKSGFSPALILAAAADHPGFLPFRIGHVSHSGGNSMGLVAMANEQQVFVVSLCLDDLLNHDALLRWPAMHRAWAKGSLVVKIDVEGFEAVVVQGMKKLLVERRCRKLIVEINPERARGLGVFFKLDDYLESFGYRPIVDAAGRSHFDQCFVPVTGCEAPIS